MCCVLGLASVPTLWQVQGYVGAARAVATRPRPASTVAPFACTGPRDLIIDRGYVTIAAGVYRYDRVCVQDKGVLTSYGALTLRVGALYVAADSAISTDGPGGSYYASHDCAPGSLTQDGGTGFALTIVARRAIIRGRISSNGGPGWDSVPNCTGIDAPGNGGNGGTVVVEADASTLSGQVEARGGAGGVVAGAGRPYPFRDRGGRGGHIALMLAHPDPRVLWRHLDVSGGASHRPGPASPNGSAQIRALAPAQQRVLPPAPSPLVTIAGVPPERLPLDARFARVHHMACGAGDLRIGAGQVRTLTGVHRYPRVCVGADGLLVARHDLTLTAHTILVARGGRITADGLPAVVTRGGSDGRYEQAGRCTTDHAAPHAGVAGVVPDPVGLTGYNGSEPLTANAGAGGGRLTLTAEAILVAGMVSADGGAGQGGSAQQDAVDPVTDAIEGAGGGSGGGLRLVARDLQASGSLSVAGGGGGPPAPGFGSAGRRGGTGCIKLFAGALHATAGILPAVGPVVLGSALPSDPAPPPNGGGRYFDATAHTLAPAFAGFWGRYGGLDAFGAPQSESFVDGGHLVQYTDRAEFEVIGGRVTLAPLGRLLTAGRLFRRVPPVVSTVDRLYVPATGQVLAGRYLTYWRGRRGATVLGVPISGVMREANGDGSNRRYAVQWFENGRLEYHPELAGTRYEMEVGLVGVEALRRRGWLP